MVKLQLFHGRGMYQIIPLGDNLFEEAMFATYKQLSREHLQIKQG